MVCLCLVLFRILPLGEVEVLCALVQDILDAYTMFAVLPSFQTLLYLPLDGVGCGDMLGSLQYHRLEDNGPL